MKHLITNPEQLMKRFILSAACTALVFGSSAGENKNRLGPPKPEYVEKVKAALPDKAPAKPAKDRKILIVTRCEGYVHKSIPLAAETLRLLGEKTGAYTAVETKELDVFNDQDLAAYDAVLFMSSTKLDPTPEQREALLKFVRGGKGMIGIHAAADSFYLWDEGAKMLGGRFDGHPWTSKCTVRMKLDEPDHPINACFGGESFSITDEIFQFKNPYSRENQRVIVSLDMDDPDTKAVKGGKAKGVKRTDGDFAVTWLRPEGQGRVFYCSIGHNPHNFWDTRVLEHYLAGIQYALGDYAVPDEIP